ncbi:SdiA-regulated domain-containing protein [Synechococcus sp. RSCCF101]|uniref:SdiA-regulated domain-containing protein n=1 Tax=Synechococcus sp. RSCCF101 TaxID=2511069 RepID=UPI001786C250|nr:SdiA-regulated domain-containing protein [Synechococcus sp. RSCCF101]
MAASAVPWFSLTYLDRHKLRGEGDALREPSGLALCPDGSALWTVSDDSRHLVLIDPEGQPIPGRSFRTGEEGLEALALDPAGRILHAVQEDTTTLLSLDLEDQRVVQRQPLAAMEGYAAVAELFEQGPANKGLEGLSVHSGSGALFALKEGQPRLMLEIAPDLSAIRHVRRLGPGQGFVDSVISDAELDLSGLCHQPGGDRFWIISDRASRLFLYDWQNDAVIQSALLAYGRRGELHCIDKAEGVAVDPQRQRLYVVSDSEARLYVFDLRH